MDLDVMLDCVEKALAVVGNVMTAVVIRKHFEPLAVMVLGSVVWTGPAASADVDTLASAYLGSSAAVS